jgi:hypothetical protein
MSWTDVDLTGVSTDMELIPEGTYEFALLPGAKYGQWNPAKIELGAKIVSGEYAGRVQYFSYGDPEKVPSMLVAFKRLEEALAKNTGVSITEGEDPVTYLNNPDVVGGKFIAPIRHRTYEKKGEVDAQGNPVLESKSDVSVYKVKAVPVA